MLTFPVHCNKSLVDFLVCCYEGCFNNYYFFMSLISYYVYSNILASISYRALPYFTHFSNHSLISEFLHTYEDCSVCYIKIIYSCFLLHRFSSEHFILCILLTNLTFLFFLGSYLLLLGSMEA